MALINYYQKERILKILALVFMSFLLVINLFPIFWMVFCSFKNNNDILGGNVGFSRARNDIYDFSIINDKLYVFSVDGSVSRYSRSSLEYIDQLKIKGLDINHTKNSSHIYMTSSTKGIKKIDIDTLKVVKSAKMPVRGVDTNKLGNTSVVLYKDKLYFTVELKGLRNLYVYDQNKLKLEKIIQLPLPDEDFIRSMFLDGDYLYLGTNRELVQFSIPEEKITKQISLGDRYYPSGAQKVLKVEDGRVYMMVGTGIKIIDLESQEISEQYNYGLKGFEDSYFSGKNLYVAASAGLTVVDTDQKKVIGEYHQLMKELLDGVVVNNESDYNSSEITAVELDGDSLILGSSYGRISVLKLESDKPHASLQIPLGYRLFKLQNYVDLWKNIDFGLYLRNSVIISLLTMFFAMVLATLTSYALVRYRFPGNKAFGISILATQMIPQIMYLIPLFMLFNWLTKTFGIPVKGTYAGLVFIYTAFFVPFSIWILRSFFAAIPVDLEESARIDGCNAFQVFYKITLPLAIPGIIATGIYIFLTAWDELMFAWVLTNKDTITIPIGIRNFVGNYQNRYDLLMAAATVATVPVLILFFLLQKHIVKGLTAGAVKG